MGIWLLVFVSCWDCLAEEGQCDERGGMEYSRVLREWVLAGEPRDCERFIREHANRGPGGMHDGRAFIREGC